MVNLKFWVMGITRVFVSIRSKAVDMARIRVIVMV
jgi:hypothetical protein